MKKYRLTDQKSILGALTKLKDKALQSPTNNKQYTIISISGEKDIFLMEYRVSWSKILNPQKEKEYPKI